MLTCIHREARCSGLKFEEFRTPPTAAGIRNAMRMENRSSTGNFPRRAKFVSKPSTEMPNVTDRKQPYLNISQARAEDSHTSSSLSLMGTCSTYMLKNFFHGPNLEPLSRLSF